MNNIYNNTDTNKQDKDVIYINTQRDNSPPSSSSPPINFNVIPSLPLLLVYKIIRYTCKNDITTTKEMLGLGLVCREWFNYISLHIFTSIKTVEVLNKSKQYGSTVKQLLEKYNNPINPLKCIKELKTSNYDLDLLFTPSLNHNSNNSNINQQNKEEEEREEEEEEYNNNNQPISNILENVSTLVFKYSRYLYDPVGCYDHCVDALQSMTSLTKVYCNFEIPKQIYLDAMFQHSIIKINLAGVNVLSDEETVLEMLQMMERLTSLVSLTLPYHFNMQSAPLKSQVEHLLKVNTSITKFLYFMGDDNLLFDINRVMDQRLGWVFVPSNNPSICTAIIPMVYRTLRYLSINDFMDVVGNVVDLSVLKPCQVLETLKLMLFKDLDSNSCIELFSKIATIDSLKTVKIVGSKSLFVDKYTVQDIHQHTHSPTFNYYLQDCRKVIRHVLPKKYIFKKKQLQQQQTFINSNNYMHL